VLAVDKPVESPWSTGKAQTLREVGADPVDRANRVENEYGK